MSLRHVYGHHRNLALLYLNKEFPNIVRSDAAPKAYARPPNDEGFFCKISDQDLATELRRAHESFYSEGRLERAARNGPQSVRTTSVAVCAGRGDRCFTLGKLISNTLFHSNKDQWIRKKLD